MRIKIIDLPDYETDPHIIADHFKAVLKAIRKKKLARNLIGEDVAFGRLFLQVFMENKDLVEWKYTRVDLCRNPIF